MSRPSETATRADSSYAPAETRRINRTAIWSLVLSILTLGGLGSLAGIILGFSARRRIAETGQRGTGLALAGIVVGVITLVFAIVYWVVIARHFGGASHGGGGGGGGY
jgi:uncharacterized BrkB/YihY/UPF0761 family membrane protein